MASNETFLEQIHRIKRNIQQPSQEELFPQEQRRRIDSAMQDTMDTIVFSPTQKFMGAISFGAQLNEIRTHVRDMADEDLNKFDSDKNSISDYFYFSLCNAKETRRHKIGNCGEYAILCAINLLCEGIDNIELCTWGNHQFLRIGKCIVDPWRGVIRETDPNYEHYRGELGIQERLQSVEFKTLCTIKFSDPAISNTIDLFLQNYDTSVGVSLSEKNDELTQLKNTIRFHFQFEGTPTLFFEDRKKLPAGVELLLQAESFDRMKEIARSKHDQFITLGRSKRTSNLYRIIRNANSAREAIQELEAQRIISKPYSCG